MSLYLIIHKISNINDEFMLLKKKAKNLFNKHDSNKFKF